MATKLSRREILVFVSGEAAETYLKHLHRRHRANVNLEVRLFDGPPTEIVARAGKAKTEGEKTERRGRGRAHDEVWCVLDAADIEELCAVGALAVEHGVALAISNPIFELWLLLHFVDLSEPILPDDIRKQVDHHLGSAYGFNDETRATLIRNHETAVARAQALDKSRRTQAAPGNPGSDVWRLIAAITGDTT